MATGTTAPDRANIDARSLRTDSWWAAPLTTFTILLAFVFYGTWRAFEGANYYAAPYLSPFYSPCLSVNCVEGSADLGTPVGGWFPLSPALIILPVLLLFRLTCYYYRKAYYRAFWLSPPACAVSEPHGRYSGERRFPLILQNSHRIWLYFAVLQLLILTWDVALAFRSPEGEWGHMGLGTLVLAVNAALLWLYTLSCHSCRHVIGGRLNHYGKHPVRYRLWTYVSAINGRHMQFAWVSLFSVALTDLYVRAVAAGALTDLRFF
ncbi:MAG: hypothetical protein ACRDPK_02840 [Carbonactinosporaceae bacterium]